MAIGKTKLAGRAEVQGRFLGARQMRRGLRAVARRRRASRWTLSPPIIDIHGDDVTVEGQAISPHGSACRWTGSGQRCGGG